jgi:Tol biopolymer transport system component
MNVDGTSAIQLTTDPAAEFDPSWSPDGKQIAFRSHRDGDEEIYVMNTDGTNQTNITDHPQGDFSPAWSLDGERIAFASERAGDLYPNLYLMNPDGTDVINLTDNRSEGEYPAWSPVGSEIAFACYQGGGRSAGTSPNYDICRINRDGTGLVNLTNDATYYMHPVWSPDGEKIAFMSERDGWPTLPAYTPLGYKASCSGDREIYVINADGTEPVNLTNFPHEDDEMPTWIGDSLLI